MLVRTLPNRFQTRTTLFFKRMGTLNSLGQCPENFARQPHEEPTVERFLPGSCTRSGGNLQSKEDIMSLGLVLLIVLAVLLVGAFPRWSYSNGWGYAPSGALGVVLLIVLVLLFMGRL